MGEDDTEVVKIEKTDDEEEINARNEVNLSINDSTSEYNRNFNVTVKSKVKDIPELSNEAWSLAEKIRNFNGKPNKDGKAGAHFG